MKPSIPLLLLPLLLLLSSCLTPRQKLSKLIAEHPQLIAEYRPDTLRTQIINPYQSIERPITLGEDTTRTLTPHGELKPDSLVIKDVPGVRVVLRGSAQGSIKIEKLPDTLSIERVVNTPVLVPTSAPVVISEDQERTPWMILIGGIVLLFILYLFKERP